ncbi:MAG: hypothetical protein ACYC6P_08270 [Ignavibacteriaceae bacterium]
MKRSVLIDNFLNNFPIVGDWDGDHGANFGIYRVADRQFWLTLITSGSGSNWKHIDFDDEGTIPFVYSPIPLSLFSNGWIMSPLPGY